MPERGTLYQSLPYPVKDVPMSMLTPAVLARHLAVGLYLTTAAAAQTGAETATYTVSIAGLTAGKLTLAVNRSDTAYAVKSRAESVGLAGLFRSFLVVSTAKGRVRDGTLRPDSYRSASEGARAGRSAEIAYAGGIPRVLQSEQEDDREDAPVIDPATMSGTVDPLTAMYAVLQTVMPQAQCDLDLSLYDGHRHSILSLRPDPDNALSCLGLYRRVNGYPSKDLAKQRDFPFSIAYTALPDGQLQVTEISLASSFGTARVTRD